MESDRPRGGESVFNVSDKFLRIEIMADTATTFSIAGCSKRRPKEQVMNVYCSAAASTTVVRVQTLRISSSILAAKTPSFSKLFDSKQRHYTLRINASEEAVLMELLKFMCSDILEIDELLTADQFEVFGRMRQCCQRLQNSPMTLDSALFYLELPHTVRMADAIQPLTIAAKKYLAAHYKDITRFREEVMALPLSGIEAILASDDLQVESEDAVYDFVLKWARQHYNSPEERREVLGTRIAPLIRFPYMTCSKLQKVLTCDDFKHNRASNLLLEALFIKANHSRSASASLKCRFAGRAYKYRPVKVVEFELPKQQCVVYLELKREECATLFPSGHVRSEAFHLFGPLFFLSAECNMDQQGSFHCFDLFLGMQENSSACLAVDYEFAARSRPTNEFVSKYKGNYTFTGGKVVGHKNLFAIPWNSFIAEDSLLFIDDVLHLRAEFTIKH